MRFQTDTLTSPKPGEKCGTFQRLFLMVILFSGIALAVEEKPVPVSYDLNVTIEPTQGTLAVRGKIGVPVEAGAKTLQFALHETFAIKKLAVNDRAVKFSVHPGDPSPIYPATRKVIVSEEQFQKVMEGDRSEVRALPADAPSLAKVPFDGSGFVVRYYKGSLMLDSIRQTMGNDAFAAAAREFFQTYTGKSIGTAEFRSFWKEKLGGNKAFIDVWLDSGGGLPQVPSLSQNAR